MLSCQYSMLHMTATLAQETICQLAKLVSLYRPSRRIRAIPCTDNSSLTALRENSGAELACKGSGQCGRVCLTARLGEPHLFLLALVR